MLDESPRQRYLRRLGAMKNEASSWRDHWRDLSNYILPRRGRFLNTDRNDGSKRNDKIINNTPTRAARILSSGMMAGITSPARPWFKLTTPDPGLTDYGPVRSWLHQVEETLRLILARSNAYNALHNAYADMATFGTTAMFVDDDVQDVIRAYVLPTGQYYLGNSARLQVDSTFRELSMTARQLVEAFGLAKVSRQVREAVERGNGDMWVEVLHVIEPNSAVEYGKLGARGMAWKGCWLETSKALDAGAPLLKEGGYHENPVMGVRWNVTGEDIYGHGPGMDALGDAKALQKLELKKAQAAAKIIDPPMRGPSSLKNQRTSLLPGDFTAVDATSGGQTFEPAMLVPPAAIQVIGEEIQRHESRVNSAFYADLWLMMADSDRREVTAREVAERHEEKMLQLGPVLERLEDELLDPFIDRVFGVCFRAGLLPPPPQELQGSDLRVEYTSIMSQAQKLLGTASVERLAGFAGNIAAVRPDILDNLDADEMVREYADMLGTNPKLIRPQEKVDAIRQEKAKQALAQQQGQAALVASQGAKTLSETDMQGDTALTRLVGALGGVAGAGGPKA